MKCAKEKINYSSLRDIIILIGVVFMVGFPCFMILDKMNFCEENPDTETCKNFYGWDETKASTGNVYIISDSNDSIIKEIENNNYIIEYGGLRAFE